MLIMKFELANERMIETFRIHKTLGEPQILNICRYAKLFALVITN